MCKDPGVCVAGGKRGYEMSMSNYRKANMTGMARMRRGQAAQDEAAKEISQAQTHGVLIRSFPLA